MEFVAAEVKKLTVKIGGESHQMRLPKVKDQRALSKVMKQLDEGSNDQVDAMIKWLDDLGLPERATDELSVSELSRLVESLVESDKKK